MFVRKILKNEGNSVDDSAVDAGIILRALVDGFFASTISRLSKFVFDDLPWLCFVGPVFPLTFFVNVW